MCNREVQGGSHRPDVVRSRSAAATDHRGPRREHARHHPSEVVRAGRIDELAFDTLGQAGVRHDRARDLDVGSAGALEGVEAGLRADAAVHAQDIDASFDESRGRRFGGRSVGQLELLTERQLGDDRDVGCPPGFVDRQEEVVEVGEGLDDEQVDAPLQEALDLLPERLADASFGVVDRAASRSAKWPDGAADERLVTGYVPCLAGELCPTTIERARLGGEPVRRQANPVRAEGRGLDCVRAGLQVFAMDRADHVRAGDDELIQRRPLRDAAAEQQCAHGAVEQERAPREPLVEALPFA